MPNNRKPSCEADGSQQPAGEAICEDIAIQEEVTKGSVSQAISPTVSLASGGEQLTTDTQSSKFGNESCSKQPNCYKCLYRRSIPGDAHSECVHPRINDVDRMVTGFALLAGQRSSAMKRLNVTANQHGIDSGWFWWPLNFDPSWLISCDGFTEKDNAQ